VIPHVRDILNDPAAGVRVLCPSFHGFWVPGYAYDLVWAISVTHEGCAYPDVILQKTKQAMNLTAEIHHHQPFGCYTIEHGIFSMYFYVTVYGMPINFLSAENFLQWYVSLVYKLK